MNFNTIPEALQDLKQGKIILVTDDPDRENMVKSWEKSMKIRRFYENRAYQEAKDNGDLF